MSVLVAFPILSLLLIFQSAVVSRVPLIYGTADLVLLALIAWALQRRVKTAWVWGIIGGLFVSFASGLPFGAILIGYLLSITIAVLLRQRIWQLPILAMFAATFLGTLITHTVSLIALRIVGTALPIWDSINQVILPSALLNLVLAIPTFALISDLAKWLYPQE